MSNVPVVAKGAPIFGRDGLPYLPAADQRGHRPGDRRTGRAGGRRRGQPYRASLRFDSARPTDPFRHMGYGGARRGRTDKDGRFRIEQVYPGDYYLAVSHAAYMKAEGQFFKLTAARSTRKPFVSKRGFSVKLTAADKNGEPLRRATVMVKQKHLYSEWRPRRVVTDEEGVAVLGPIDRTSYRLTARQPGRLFKPKVVTITSEEPLTVRFERVPITTKRMGRLRHRRRGPTRAAQRAHQGRGARRLHVGRPPCPQGRGARARATGGGRATSISADGADDQHLPGQRPRPIRPGSWPTRRDRRVRQAQLGGGQVNTATGDFVFGMTEAYLIENGEIAEPIREGNLIGNGPEVLTRIDMRSATTSRWGRPAPAARTARACRSATAHPRSGFPSLTVGGTAA